MSEKICQWQNMMHAPKAPNAIFLVRPVEPNPATGEKFQPNLVRRDGKTLFLASTKYNGTPVDYGEQKLECLVFPL